MTSGVPRANSSTFVPYPVGSLLVGHQRFVGAVGQLMAMSSSRPPLAQVIPTEPCQLALRLKPDKDRHAPQPGVKEQRLSPTTRNRVNVKPAGAAISGTKVDNG
jgi:hypothetical protein